MIHKYKILWILPVLITSLLNIYCKIDLGLDTGTVDINLEYYTYLYIMDADGSNQTDISISDPNHDPGYSNPVFSPDGTKILVGMGQNLFIMNIDGSNVIKLADFENDYNGDHQFSPDGMRIIFISDNTDIYITDTNGGTSSILTADICGEEYSIPSIWSPRFSPDGSKIAFCMGCQTDTVYYHHTDIYIMDADGNNPKKLTNSGNEQECLQPNFSPDGLKIVFTHYQDYHVSVINTIDIDGNNLKTLTNSSDENEEPQFSPDGSEIVYTSWHEGNSEIYLMNADGTNKTNLTRFYEWNWNPQFSPDGSKILFSRRLNGYAEIYIMNTDGSEQRNLTKTGGRVAETEFALSPDDSKIVYIRGEVKRKS
jgi:Tol biopolymer transport system component